MADYQNRKPPIGAFASMARWLPASAALVLAARDGIAVLRVAGGRDNETIRIFTMAQGSDGFLARDPHLKSILSAVLDGDR